MTEENYLAWCDYILKSYAPLFGELAISEKWEFLRGY